MNWLQEKNLHKSLVKLLGYDRIAEIKGLLNTSYSDKKHNK